LENQSLTVKLSKHIPLEASKKMLWSVLLVLAKFSLWTLFILVGLVVLYLIHVQRNIMSHPFYKSNLPSPKLKPIVGAFGEINSATTLVNYVRKYNRIFTGPWIWRIHSRWLISLQDPEDIRGALMSRPEKLGRTRVVKREFKDAGLDGLFSDEGEVWRHTRKVTARGWTNLRVKDQLGTINKVVRNLMNYWSSGTVEVVRPLRAAAFDTVVLFSSGEEINSLENRPEIRKIFDEIFESMGSRSTSHFAIWKLFKTEADKRFDHAVKQSSELMGSLIDKRQKVLQEMSTEDKDMTYHYFVDSLFEAEKANEFNREAIISNTKQFLGAGQDTTAWAITWGLYFLAKYPDTQDKLRSEVDRVLGNLSIDEDLTEKQLQELKYVGYALDETLRLKPVAPQIALEVIEDWTTPKTNILIPKKTIIMCDLLSIHTEENHWSRPLEYDPSRWESKEYGGYFPFGGGPRICPGRFLAKHEFVGVVARLAQKYTWTISTKQPDPKEHCSITLNIEGGKLLLDFEPRKL